MLITDKNELQRFSSEHRFWQGIPGLEVTKKGRIYSAFYSGGRCEMAGNFVVLLQSDDDGKSFSEPIAVAYNEKGRCYDEVLWIDPLGRLWFMWSYVEIGGKDGVYGAICDDPDADELQWSDVFFIGKYVMMNKPTVLTTREWLFPIAVWHDGLRLPGAWADNTGENREETGAFVYKCVDNRGKFVKMGGVATPERAFDEHMVLELKDGTLMMLIRTYYGIGVSYSYDQGHTWSEGTNSKIPGPGSRFFIRRLKSGRVLLVNHYQFDGRNNLTALLSEDDGKTFPYSLLLDERGLVSYPDGVEAENGYIYITYDRERGDFYGKSWEEMQKFLEKDFAREILFAKITEEDILAGKIVDKNSKLKCVISKIKANLEDENPFKEFDRFSDVDLAQYLCDKEPNEIVAKLFNHYPVRCTNMHELDNKKLDTLIEKLQKGEENKLQTAFEMIRLIRSASDRKNETTPIVETVKKILCENVGAEISVSEIAKMARVSEYYLMHTFKKQTGITIVEYKTAIRLANAKQLLIATEKTVEDIAAECGFFDANYFTKVFKKSENITPKEYRELHKKM